MKNNTYYSRNREKILKRNKLQYRADRSVRESQVEANKKYRHKKAKERKELKEKLTHDRKVWREFKVDGNLVKCCRSGYVAKCISRTTQTIRLWERKQFLPKTIRYKSHRYYTKYHHTLIISAWQKYPNDLSAFFNYINNNWNLYKKG